MEHLKVFIGWDSREDIAFQVAQRSMALNASIPLHIMPIKLQPLISAGLYTREIDPLASTEFTYSRFLVPHLAGYKGWALFLDCDFLFFGDVAELLDFCDPSKAVLCVKHDYQPSEMLKMDGVIQSNYPRKNWSSFMLFNCEHRSTRVLSPTIVNSQSGAYLHQMRWAKDEEIGDLPETWNWLEGWSEQPAPPKKPKAVHYTCGGPWFEEWQNVAYADAWNEHAAFVEKSRSVA